MYTDDLANRLKIYIGYKWRPENDIDRTIFQKKYCEKCQKYNIVSEICSILTCSMLYLVDHKYYPMEWQIGKDGQPICAAFKKIDNQQMKQTQT